ncbi:Fe-S cluster assembly ATPase SufC [Candidatus Azambacteria bacterium RBG_16_47_10]|uniref:Fe-S cluster assembly ATPase SufC n=1 Tax=Candidatus Azambacteria bacterium RBG_16_47_10 TaxID=1797292 RepID=A0A1F5AZH2_9BACT|nr:MAG: Fe-S cluster assembly ATPase SufC [Candidatus Azambacteria bacterium RBG_16_47_10]
MRKPVLEIKNITVETGGKKVIHDLSLSIGKGEIHALMGPNGSGKTSLCFAVLGNPAYTVTKGNILLDGKRITALPTEERARRGIFLSFQEPPEIGGVGVSSFLRMMAKKHAEDPRAAMKKADNAAKELRISETFMERYLNEGFSGGEKKKSEMLQLAAAAPKIALIDEIDAGVDVDSLRAIARILKDAAKNGTGMLIITHTAKLFSALKPDRVHIITNGTISASGGPALIKKIEKGGFRAHA